MNTNTHAKTLWMAQTAILAAVILLMAFTPLGYLKVGIIEITFLVIPVAIGAIMIGPGSGAVLGAVFGATSFAQAFASPFGAALLAINPFYTFLLTMVPRILMGYLVGLLFRSLFKIDKTKLISYTVASLSGAVLNTVLFIAALFLMFGQSDYLQSFGDGFVQILGVLVGLNALIEAIACMIIGAAITKGLSVALRHRQQKKAT
jgi:uncharacterized membrane protein